MAGFVPDEGETLIANLVCKRTLTDRDADLEIGLFTNVSPGDSITEATITQPSGTGYALQTLTDGSWTGAAEVKAYPEITFTAGAGGWTGSIQGYFIATKAAGGTKRILFIEVDPSGPYTMAANDTYKITPGVTVSTSSGSGIHLFRCAELFEMPEPQHSNAVRKRQGFLLVVCDEDGCHAESLMQFFDLAAS